MDVQVVERADDDLPGSVRCRFTAKGAKPVFRVFKDMDSAARMAIFVAGQEANVQSPEAVLAYLMERGFPGMPSDAPPGHQPPEIELVDDDHAR
jgi:hypothetical protein